jgi:hypothetical protein
MHHLDAHLSVDRANEMFAAHTGYFVQMMPLTILLTTNLRGVGKGGLIVLRRINRVFISIQQNFVIS